MPRLFWDLCGHSCWDCCHPVPSIGLVTVSGFIAEVGDIGRFDNPKQLQKLAGYAIVANDSGKHNGESRISYRGRKRLRYVLYEAAISLIGKNAEFREIHEYYRSRKENPLKKMQSVVAVACKVIRVFYAILTKGVDYDAEKLMRDIRRPQIQAAFAADVSPACFSYLSAFLPQLNSTLRFFLKAQFSCSRDFTCFVSGCYAACICGLLMSLISFSAS